MVVLTRPSGWRQIQTAIYPRPVARKSHVVDGRVQQQSLHIRDILGTLVASFRLSGVQVGISSKDPRHPVDDGMLQLFGQLFRANSFPAHHDTELRHATGYIWRNWHLFVASYRWRKKTQTCCWLSQLATIKEREWMISASPWMQSDLLA